MRYYACETEIAKDDRGVSIYCRATVRVENTDEFEAREFDTFPDGGTWCGACTSYHCARHTSSTHRMTCVVDAVLGYGRFEDLISQPLEGRETPAGARPALPLTSLNDEATARQRDGFGSLVHA